MHAYNKIREIVHANKAVMGQTKLQLLSINQSTITHWYNQRDKRLQKEVLEQGLSIHTQQPAIASQQLPLPVEMLSLPVGTDTTRHTFIVQENTAGQGIVRRRVLPPPVPTFFDIQPLQSSPSVAVLPATCPAQQLQAPPDPLPAEYLPYSTRHYRKRKLEKARAGMPKRPYVRKSAVVTCIRCGKDRRSELHKQHYGNIFCKETATMSFLDWKANLQREKGYGKNKKTE